MNSDRFHVARPLAAGAVLAALLACGCAASGPDAPGAGPTTGPAPALTFPEGRSVYLFDGKSLAGWKVPKLIGGGKVWLKDGEIHVGVGDGITALAWTGPVLRNDYEISLEAKRVAGGDFFCGLTFPIGGEPATLILGGWGGSLVGLSSIDGYDASENETTTSMEFKENKWYEVRVKVTSEHVVCWVDDEEIVSVDRNGKKFSVRWEVEDTVPLGLSTWKTEGVIRSVCVRKLLEAEK